MTIARRRPLIPILLAAIALVLGGVAWAGAATGRLSAGRTFTAAERCLRVLFVGNSYTSTNDLPHTFARLAASGGWGVETEMIAPGGALLSDHAADPAVGAAINGGIGGHPWTDVVLQEQGELPAVAASRAAIMAPAVSTLVRRILRAGPRPYLLETWAHRGGLPSAGLDCAAMQAAIDDAYQSTGRQAGATVIPAGEDSLTSRTRGSPRAPCCACQHSLLTR